MKAAFQSIHKYTLPSGGWIVMNEKITSCHTSSVRGGTIMGFDLGAVGFGMRMDIHFLLAFFGFRHRNHLLSGESPDGSFRIYHLKAAKSIHFAKSSIEKNTEFAKAVEKVFDGSREEKRSGIELAAANDLPKLWQFVFHLSGIGRGTESGEFFSGRNGGKDFPFEGVRKEESRKHEEFERTDFRSCNTAVLDAADEFPEQDVENVAQVTEAVFENGEQQSAVENESKRETIGEAVAVSVSEEIEPGEDKHVCKFPLFYRSVSRDRNDDDRFVFTIHADRAGVKFPKEVKRSCFEKEPAFGAGESVISLTTKGNDAVMSETVGAIGNIGRVRDDSGFRVRHKIKNNLAAVKFLFCCFLFALAFFFPCLASEIHASGNKIPERFSCEHSDSKSTAETDKSGTKGIRVRDKSPELNKGRHDESSAFLCYFAMGFNVSILMLFQITSAIGDELWKSNIKHDPS